MPYGPMLRDLSLEEDGEISINLDDLADMYYQFKVTPERDAWKSLAGSLERC